MPASASRFNGVAEAYARFRPSYPAETIALLLDGLPTPADAVDIGAGTGIGTRALLEAGSRVIAIEPSDDMRGAAIASGLDVRSGTAYETGLADRSADLVTAFQAFHWFADDRALAEFRRILKPGGRFAAVWNERDVSSDLAREISEIDLRYGESHMIGTFNRPAGGIRALLRRNGFSNVRKVVIANGQRIDEDGIVGRIRSLSFAPREGPELERYIAETREAFVRHRESDGRATLALNTDAYIGDYAP